MTATTVEAGTGLPTIELEQASILPDDRVVEWEATGEGEPLVWIEGGPGLPAHLARADVAPVVDRFRCYLVNAPGCGRTSPPPHLQDYDLTGHVEFFETTRRALGLGPVTVMGHSWGGLVAGAWAATHRDAVRRLILVEGYAGAGSIDQAAADAERDRAFDRLRDRPWFPAAYAAYRAAWSSPPGTRSEEEHVATTRLYLPFYFADPDSEVSQGHLERLRRELRSNVAVSDAWYDETAGWDTADYRPLLGRIACPTLVIVGEYDWICGPAVGEPLARAIPTAELVILPGQGHLPQYEAPELFRATIDAWMLRNSRGRGLAAAAPDTSRSGVGCRVAPFDGT